MGQPLLRVDERDAGALGGRVVLVEHRAPPVDHLLLDLDRARRRRVDRDLQRRHVVARADLLGQLQHPDEHRRDPLAVRDPVPLDRGQRGLRLEPLHHDDRAADRLDRGGEPQRRGVVERRGGEVDGVGVEPVHPPEHGDVEITGLVDLALRERRADPLRTAGGAGGVQHVRAARLVGQRLGGDAVERRVVVGVTARTGDLTAVGEPDRHVHQRLHGGREPGHAGRDDQCLRPAVRDDVGRLVRGEVVVDRRDVETGPLGRPVHLVEPRGVLRDQGDDVAPAQAGVDEVARQARGTGFQLASR